MPTSAAWRNFRLGSTRLRYVPSFGGWGGSHGSTGSTGSSSTKTPGWISDLGTAVRGGIAQGLSRRFEAQVGGRKAAEFGATGGQPTSMSISQQASAQGASQGQQSAFAARENSLSRQHQSVERELDRQHEMNMLQMSSNGDTTGGQLPTPGLIDATIDAKSFQNWRKRKSTQFVTPTPAKRFNRKTFGFGYGPPRD